MRRLTVFAHVLIILSLLLSACGASEPTAVEGTPVGKNATPSAASTPASPSGDKYGGTFIWGVEDDAPGLNPILTDNSTDLYVYGFSHDPLTWAGENYPAEMKGILAESWEQSTDGLTWTLHLRKGVKWHDGTEYSADDVLFWASAIQDPDTGAFWFSDRFYAGDQPFTFEKVDSHTVKVTTSVPVPTLMNLIVVPMIPANYFVENGISNADMQNSASYTEGTPGTGPFKLSKWQHGQAIVLERFDDGWRGKPYLDKVVFQIIPDPEARLVALQTGEIHWAEINPQDVAKLLGNPKITVKPFLLDSIQYVALNNKNPNLSDKRTRQAMMYALDREAILEGAALGYGKLIDSPWTSVVSAYEPLPGYEYDVEKAKKLLAEVGWVPGPDGILVAQNVPGVQQGTRFTLEYSVTSEADKIATLIQSYLQEVGIDCVQRMMDPATFVAENRGTADKKFALHTEDFGWLGANPGAYTWTYGSGDPVASTFSYDNQEVAGLFDKAKTAATEEESLGYYKQAAKMIWDDVPVLWLWYREWIFAYNNALHVEEAGIDTGMYAMFTAPEKLWIEK